ncbi:ER membrane protein SH3-domain-containing protein [Flammula alnicola]|nr:ER membrane protein SH3-domain-containing protein [Flammula alnicola]
MGVRSAIVVCVTSFLWVGLSYSRAFFVLTPAGSLFTHWIADSLTLWKSPVTDEHLWTAASYYSILAKGPSEIFYFLSAVVILGATTILWSLNDLRAGNIMFDGGSIFLFGTTIVMYLYTVLPDILTVFSALPTHQLKDPIPSTLRNATLELASSNLICSVALTGVLALQAGRFWAESADDDEEDFVMGEQADETSAAAAKGRRSRAKTPEISIRDDKVKPFLQQRVQAS